MNEHLRRSRKQEKRGAKLLGGSVNSGSGNGPRKNDVRSDEWSVEYKTTTAKSYSLKLADLEVAERQAILEHRSALFGIDFARGAGRTSRYVVCPESELYGLLFDVAELRAELDETRERLLDAQANLAMINEQP
jgi:hypothetical protein